jgi:hypothetical protein
LIASRASNCAASTAFIALTRISNSRATFAIFVLGKVMNVSNGFLNLGFHFAQLKYRNLIEIQGSFGEEDKKKWSFRVQQQNTIYS